MQAKALTLAVRLARGEQGAMPKQRADYSPAMKGSRTPIVFDWVVELAGGIAKAARPPRPPAAATSGSQSDGSDWGELPVAPIAALAATTATTSTDERPKRARGRPKRADAAAAVEGIC